MKEGPWANACTDLISSAGLAHKPFLFSDWKQFIGLFNTHFIEQDDEEIVKNKME
jgi:hypothetical protein